MNIYLQLIGAILSTTSYIASTRPTQLYLKYLKKAFKKTSVNGIIFFYHHILTGVGFTQQSPNDSESFLA